MVSGYRKNMYYVRGTGSSRFSEAYFVLRAGADTTSTENDLAAEADRIIRQHFPAGKRRWHRPRHLPFFTFGIGVIAGIVLAAII